MSQPPSTPPPPPRQAGGWRPPPPPPGRNPFAHANSGSNGTPPSGHHGTPSGDRVGWGPASAAQTGQFGHHNQFNPNTQHDPSQALGAPAPASVSIESFAEPPSRSNWIIAAVVGVIVIVMLVAAFMVRGNATDQAASTPTPSPSITPSVVPSAVAAGRAVPFESRLDDAVGYWEIQDAEWTSDGLMLTITLRLDSGNMEWTFFAMDETDTRVYEAVPSGSSQDLSSGAATAPDTRTGVLYFPVPRHGMLIVLTDSSRRQIATLRVAA